MVTGQNLVDMAMTMSGKPYVFGHEVRLDDPNPKAFDCSELIEWACAMLGVPFPDGSWIQIDACNPVSVDKAIKTPGALLYFPGHIVISRGNNTTIEARNRNAGVGSFTVVGRGWTRGGLIKGIDYSGVNNNAAIDWVGIALAIEAAKLNVLRLGSRGDAVIWAQAGINNLSGRGLELDGVFGPATERAVIDLQRWFGVGVDGVIGPVTWSIIFP